MITDIDQFLSSLPEDQPVLIAGPTASGKSALALRIVQSGGGIIVNADALQVFECWHVLSARPDAHELARANHALYGHIAYQESYSTGQWLREVELYLGRKQRPVIVGGTGLNFTSLTEGLAEIPPTPQAIRAEADSKPAHVLQQELRDQDPETIQKIDMNNPARVQRAWEVLRTTGRSLASWHKDTPPALLPLSQAYGVVIDAPKDWLTPRIEQRFRQMLETGAVDEVRALMPIWDPALPASRAIGAPELMSYLNGDISLEKAQQDAIVATRQYAKRQRTWFNSRMKQWQRIDASCL